MQSELWSIKLDINEKMQKSKQNEYLKLLKKKKRKWANSIENCIIALNLYKILNYINVYVPVINCEWTCYTNIWT